MLLCLSTTPYLLLPLLLAASPTAARLLAPPHTHPTGEQTWPTEEELSAAAAASKRMRKRRLPAGTSEYQAAWILDDDDDDGSDGSDGSDDGFEGGCVGGWVC